MSYRLLSYDSDQGPRAGVLIDGLVHDAAALSGKYAYDSVLGVLNDWDVADPLFSGHASSPPAGGSPLSTVRLLAPLLYPGQVWAAGANYADHIDEMGDDDEYSVVNAKTVAGGRAWHFSKTSRGAIVGPDSIHPLPYYSQTVDWEIELAVVIGKPAYRVSAADALDYVAGYTIANDLSARDFVARPGIAPDSPFKFDWTSHKGFEGSCPMGPWITPARDIPDPHNLDLKLWVDDELMQDSNSKYMIFNIGEQIEELSARVTMYPGDVVMTGTPAGVGMGRGVFLKPGQNLRLYIEGIGELRHGFCAEG